MSSPSGLNLGSRLRVAVLLYHEVCDSPGESGFQTTGSLRYKHGRQEFRENLERIAACGMFPALVHQVDFQRPGRHLLLTFDDGGSSAMHIADELERRGWRGNFFVTTKMLDRPRFLTGGQVRQLHERGHLIGSHSHSHPDVCWRLSHEQMLQEWSTSRDILEGVIGRPVEAASVPGGDMNLETQRSAAAAGIRYLFTSEPRIRPWSVDGALCLGRYCPTAGTPADKISALLAFRGWRALQLERAAKQAAKRVLGPFFSRSSSLDATLEKE